MSKKKILIIDDEVDLTMLMEHILLSTGLYEVAVACDGAEGCEKVVSEKPDLIMLDYIMPKMRGDDVLRFIRTELGLSEVSVVIMSGLGREGYWDQKEEVVDPNIDSVPDDLLGESSSVAFPRDLVKNFKVKAMLSKPFSKQKLLEMVERVFDMNN